MVPSASSSTSSSTLARDPASSTGSPLASDRAEHWIFRTEADESLARSEVLSVDQLERHGRALANWHTLGKGKARDRLLPRLTENARVLRVSYELTHASLKEGRGIVPAAEWLIDNFYVIETQVRLARQHLPRNYSRELPRLAGGPSDGLPRVYDIAMELISHADGKLDADNLRQFVAAYQAVTPLTLGELWAIPIMLRLALVENLRRIAIRIVWQQRDREVAGGWADRLLEVLEHDPKNSIVALADLIRSDPPMRFSFVAEFSQRLQGRTNQFPAAMQWVEQRLAEQGQTVDRLIHLNTQTQAADQVSMGNTITSLRSLGAMDWRSFVEEQSRVERILRSDPAGVYPQMSFATRDRYRHIVEEITKRSPQTEAQVARAAVELAQESHKDRVETPEDYRARAEHELHHHVGYYLLDDGRRQLEKQVGYHPTFLGAVSRMLKGAPLATYLGTVTLLCGVLLGGLAAAGWELGLFSAIPTLAWVIPLLLVAAPAAQAAITLTNWICTLLVRPRPVAQLDYSRGVPQECRTIVVVPTMLTSPKGIEHLLEQLEVRYLANRERHLHFALLTDLGDADQAVLPKDQALIDQAREGIDALNRKYVDGKSDLFYLFHRPRLFNEREGVWMGRERKRGKLEDFNALLRGGRRDAFQVIVGALQPLANVRYVITLDTDTQLPRDAAHELIGCMAHPLNRPRFDANTGCATGGYAILQPRVALTVPDSNASEYSRLFGGDAGLDPYTGQVSDVYHDLFGHASFIGKGIYDLHGFEAALAGRFSENCILSHDLIESGHARTGLVSDITLFEGFPARYLADASRRHRWVRGDWQLLAWLTGRVPTPEGRAPNPLSWLARWKIFDNLRRSVTPPLLLAAFIAAWLVVPAYAWFWTLALVGLLFLPTLLSAAPGFFRVPEEMPVGLHLKNKTKALGRSLFQGVFNLSVLPYEAHWNLDAIGRVLYRIFVSRRGLLEWQTASDAERRASGHLRDHYELMYAGTIVPMALLVVLVAFARSALLPAAPLLALWLAGPYLAWRLSRPRVRHAEHLTANQRQSLRRLARQTWHYFDTFVTEQENWLAPDNFQEIPTGVIASRTSPTNIGMGLTANLAAWDFGYISSTQMAQRISKTFGVMDQLERFHGHFYNWYETRTLQPIHPQYVSSVDSGNLAGLLLVLRGGLEEVGQHPIVRPQWFEGLADTLRVVVTLADQKPADPTGSPPVPREFRLRLDRLLSECRTSVQGLTAAHRQLGHLAAGAADLASNSLPYQAGKISAWLHRFERQCHDFEAEILRLAPWVAVPLPSLDDSLSLDGEARERFQGVLHQIESLDRNCQLQDLPARADGVRAALERLLGRTEEFSTNGHGEAPGTERSHAGPRELWLKLIEMFESSARQGAALLQSLDSLALQAGEFANMDFRFLYDTRRDLLAIGYNVSDRRMDQSFYDLLASEARVASFVAVSQGQLPREHWFSLGRMMTTQDGDPTLLSWSGSMFEYLMPMLILPQYEGTLLDFACRGAVSRQIEYGRQNGIPWGVSESCYNVTDINMTYQYRAFGVPGLGLQRGLGEDLVIAPYASVMGLMVAPTAASENITRMEEAGWLGEWGFVDAVDHTPTRRGPSGEPVPCRTYMAHHSGMSLLSLASVLLERPMQRRLLADPLLRAHDLLLQERVPDVIRPVYPHPAEMREVPVAGQKDESEEPATRVFTTADTPAPEVHLLGNGEYHVMISNAGGGYSQWNGLSVTRWLPDAAQDRWGQFCFIRDRETGEFWSATDQPTPRVPESYRVTFCHGRAEFHRIDNDLDVQTMIGVSPEDHLEVRRTTVKNIGRLARSIDLTTYAEVVLAPQAADQAHRAFSNLFVTTELLPEKSAILCTRRPRSAGEKPPYLFHMMVLERPRQEGTSFETDRSKFVGRGGSLQDPAALRSPGALSGSHGAVLDPIVSIRRSAEVAPDQNIRVDVVTGVAPTREAALALIEKYQDFRLCDRVFELSWTHDQVVRRQVGVTDADVQTFCRLAAPILYGRSVLGQGKVARSPSLRNQSHLWAYGIGGDLPIVLVKATDPGRIGLVKRVLQAHAFWRMKGLAVDLVIWNDDAGGYRHDLHDSLMGLISSGPYAALIDRPGGIFVRRTDQMAEEDRRLLENSAAVILTDTAGTLREQLERRRSEPARTLLRTSRSKRTEPDRDVPSPRRELIFFNGYGGFTPDGKEYVMLLRPGMTTPAPWCNVLANENFGTIVSESGLGYTWFHNAHEYRLTPWHNDPVSDPAGEALYIRDEETGRFFSPTPGPARGSRPYVARHGFGYSVWEYEEAGLQTELTTFVALDAPVKLMLLRVRNASGRRRSLSATGYVEWVLGERRARPGVQIVTELDSQTGAILARNNFSIEYGAAVGFFQTSELNRGVTCDRTEFLGRNGSLADPAAMRNTRLSGRAGGGLDPCCALQSSFELADGEEREIVFVLGAADDAATATALLQRFKRVGDARRTLEKVWRFWEETLSAVHVETPDAGLNVLANGWLLYQTLACRFWGRSGFYQSGGAYGFRDQLQDSMALLYSAPYLTRDHLLRSASRQFREGDVQHWWHPPTGRGVRTHFSDDYLWLPFVATRYVRVTGDTGVLDESIGFLTDRAVTPEEESYYGLPQRAEESASLYEHCRRAVKNGLKFGRHGLPLMGCGDWNDGMNMVGAEGKGESVWLAFFLHQVLTDMAAIARTRHDDPFAEECLYNAELLRNNIEDQAWDGQWYKRAWFDDGRPLGSSENTECRIDSLPQSWAVLTGFANPQRMKSAMEAVDQHLVRRDLGIIQLFDPPFDKGSLEPGYIKGYLPGVRENGGQYTHAAIWTTMAFAQMGETRRAWECFDLINPVNHSDNEAETQTYKVEPYVVAADVYSVSPHQGRGGWTWYTGSAGWMYRLIVETFLGLKVEGGTRLSFRPCVPADWGTNGATGYTIQYRYHSARYRLQFRVAGERTHLVNRVTIDGQDQPDCQVPLVDDGREHLVEIELGSNASA